MRDQSPRRVRVLALALVLCLIVPLAACGRDADDSESAIPASTAASSTQPSGVDATPGGQGGELRVATGFLPATLDPGGDGFGMVQFGIAETLTRIGADQQIEPWLAESVESEDTRQWRIRLRDGATFWNGEPVDAAAVEASLRRALDTIPSAAQYLDPDVTMTVVDERTLDLSFDDPLPTLPNNLATFHLVIATEDASALGGLSMTGPYQVAQHTPDDRLVLNAYAGHWSGTPPFDSVTVRLVRDANARMLGLQAGEVDLVTEVPTELTVGVGGGVEIISSASTRVHHVVLNHARAPFDDFAVREAFAVGIDRDLLNDLTLAGLGASTSTFFPADLGLPTIPPIETDVDRAAEILDAAGWVEGGDGVRQKGGEALRFVLHTYARRPELPAIAVSIQDQLRAIGFDVEIHQVDDISAQMSSGDFEAAMFSVNLVPIGDPRYALNVSLVSDGIYNYGGIQNDRLDEIATELLTEGDAQTREGLVLEAQQIVRDDASNVYLVAAPLVIAYQSDTIAPFEMRSNDLYLIDTSIQPAS